MATKYHYFHGTTKWAQLGLGPAPEKNADKEYEAWKVNVYLDKDSLEELKNSGLGLKIKTDDDGMYVTFRRPFSKRIKDEVVEFEAPIVVDDSNNPFTDFLGNGSEVIVKVAVYDAGKFKGHRLEMVKVLKAVEFDPVTTTPDKIVIGAQEFVPF